MKDVWFFILFEAVWDIQMLGNSHIHKFRVDSNNRLIRLNEFAVPTHANGRQDVVSGDHDRVYVSLVQFPNRPVRFLLHQILHDDQAQKFGFFLQLAPRHIVHLLPVVGRAQRLVRGRDDPQPLFRVPLERPREIGRDRFRSAEGSHFLRRSFHEDVEIMRSFLLGHHGHPLHGRVERVRLQDGDFQVRRGRLNVQTLGPAASLVMMGRRNERRRDEAVVRVHAHVVLLGQLPFDGLEQFNVQRVAGQISAELYQRVASGHGLNERRIPRQLSGVWYCFLELSAPTLANSGQV